MGELTQERLKSIMHYDPETGLFTWLIAPSNRVKAGDVAGTVDGKGYIRIKYKGVKYAAHRLAFLYMTGEFPVDQVDHKNRVRSYNKWDNLRPADAFINANNKTRKIGITGLRGITVKKNKFQVRYKRKYIGLFKDLELAALVYEEVSNR
ncbi:hypothetical protein D3C80_1640090 [compost metagenome]